MKAAVIYSVILALQKISKAARLGRQVQRMEAADIAGRVDPETVKSARDALGHSIDRFAATGRSCRTLTVEDSHREFMRLDGDHSKPTPARYRTTNWSSYTVLLRKPGLLLFWLHKEMTWIAPRDGSRGRLAVFSDAAIQAFLTIKVLFNLPIRQTTWMVASLLKMADPDRTVPDYTTLCRRYKTLVAQIPNWRADGPLTQLVDSTGMKFFGDGKRQAKKHSVQRRRQWPTVHLAMDTATSDVRSVEFTPNSDGDCPVLPELLDQISEVEEVGTVTADSGYDTRRCHSAIIDRHATPIIPIRKNGRPWKEDCLAATARTETLRANRQYGRVFLKRRAGYHDRSRSDAETRCLKAFGERIAARDPDCQTAEIQIRIALMNRFSALGTAEIVRVA